MTFSFALSDRRTCGVLLGEMEQQGQLRTKATSTIVDVDPVSLG